MPTKEEISQKFRFAEDVLALPALVLAAEVYPHMHDRDYQAKPPHQLIPVNHQTAGLMCHQHYFYAFRLTPRPEVQKSMQHLADHYLDSQACNPTLKYVMQYRRLLKN